MSVWVAPKVLSYYFFLIVKPSFIHAGHSLSLNLINAFIHAG